MKILSTLLISGLITFSLNSTAADFDKHSEEMNRTLQQRIDSIINMSGREAQLKLETRVSADTQAEFLKVSFDPKLPAHRS